ncbi:hypothetical protein OIU76_027393 [Salix suchowensis]|uniref:PENTATRICOPEPTIDE REPEAT-CONTAINING PROTEIN-RELATED n=1 Tax=Salix koriyanagi TaxID=2511006 RepID=A0A9Q0W0N8_9ROSI|nr:hypothetical protein OIU76_027393 [Salix suchowensis]KAJ6758495.1 PENTATRICOPEPTIDE REPEAT-CONTAINING PROTEIN-RELATED [Salix koriyanagi]
MGLSGATPNDFTFSLNLKACGLLNSLDIGRQTHDIRVRTGFDMEESLVGNSSCSQTMEESLKPPTSQKILDVYLKCGMIKEAEKFPLEM